MRDDEMFHALVVFITMSKYILHQAHDTLGHNGIAITYQYLEQCIIRMNYEMVLILMWNNV